MTWEQPSFVEVKMDAEINSYQDDFRETPDVREPSTDVPVAAAQNQP